MEREALLPKPEGVFVATQFVVGPTEVVVERAEPILCARIARRFRILHGAFVPRDRGISLVHDAEHVRRIDGVKLESFGAREFPRFIEEGHGARPIPAGVRRSAPFEEIPHT